MKEKVNSCVYIHICQQDVLFMWERRDLGSEKEEITNDGKNFNSHETNVLVRNNKESV